MNLRVRFQDWLRERRIRYYANRMREAQARRDIVDQRKWWAEFKREHEQRSAAQVARMERGMFR